MSAEVLGDVAAAMLVAVSKVNPERKVTVAARVAPALADAVRTLADAGDRSTSREIARALFEHVSKGSASAAATTSSAVPSAPSERGEACAPPSAQGDYLVQQDQAQERE